jgi:hypothetical protein
MAEQNDMFNGVPHAAAAAPAPIEVQPEPEPLQPERVVLQLPPRPVPQLDLF